MAKFETPHPDIQELFDGIINGKESLREVDVTILSNITAKDIFKVTKANDVLKHLTHTDVVVIINDVILDQLPKEEQTIIAEEAIAQIGYDSEKGNVIIEKPDFQSHTLLLEKFGYKAIIKAKESVKSLYDKVKQDKEENSQKTKN